MMLGRDQRRSYGRVRLCENSVERERGEPLDVVSQPRKLSVPTSRDAYRGTSALHDLISRICPVRICITFFPVRRFRR
jgi:hypothetical protein